MVVEIVGNSEGRRVPQGYRGVFVDKPEVVVSVIPESREVCARMARQARTEAKRVMPRITGRTAKRIFPIWGEGVFGLWFPDPHVWFLERGVSPFTMRNLAGKTIPMWINDPTGEEQRKNPKAKTRTTEDGRRQVLIFRRAAKIGATKNVWVKDSSGKPRRKTTPRSYPGAPGRIAVRDANGRIAKGNTGVRWRHTGTAPEGYLMDALTNTARNWGYIGPEIVATDKALTGLRDEVDIFDVRTG